MKIRASVVLGVAGGLLLLAAWMPWPEATSGPAAPAPAATALADAEYGRALFVAKSCAGCHRHAEALGGQTERFEGWAGAPDLTHYKVDAQFVRAWLRDPRSIRPSTIMPDLNLSERDIDALIAFLSAGEG